MSLPKNVRDAVDLVNAITIIVDQIPASQVDSEGGALSPTSLVITVIHAIDEWMTIIMEKRLSHGPADAAAAQDIVGVLHRGNLAKNLLHENAEPQMAPIIKTYGSTSRKQSDNLTMITATETEDGVAALVETLSLVNEQRREHANSSNDELSIEWPGKMKMRTAVDLVIATASIVDRMYEMRAGEEHKIPLPIALLTVFIQVLDSSTTVIEEWGNTSGDVKVLDKAVLVRNALILSYRVHVENVKIRPPFFDEGSTDLFDCRSSYFNGDPSTPGAYRAPTPQFGTEVQWRSLMSRSNSVATLSNDTCEADVAMSISPPPPQTSYGHETNKKPSSSGAKKKVPIPRDTAAKPGRTAVHVRSGNTRAECFKCGFFGHYERDCPCPDDLNSTEMDDYLKEHMKSMEAKKTAVKPRRKRPTNEQCGNCKQFGHRYPECTERLNPDPFCYWCQRDGYTIATCPNCRDKYFEKGGKFGAETRDPNCKYFLRIPGKGTIESHIFGLESHIAVDKTEQLLPKKD